MIDLSIIVVFDILLRFLMLVNKIDGLFSS